MTALYWDQVEDRIYEAGVDRGVLYPIDGSSGVAWNGLTSVEDPSLRDSQAFYMDGIKYLERQIPGDFVAKLTAYTYPKELEECDGTQSVVPGFFVHDQKPHSFGLSYRTGLGNHLSGLGYGYRIHLIYNVYAVPDTSSYTSLGETLEANEFAWTLSSVPKLISGFKPTSHLSFDSTQIDSDILQTIEELLYGTESDNPSLPEPTTLLALFS